MIRTDIISGDCRDVLKLMPPSKFQSCVTSPPYWKLRDYEHRNQIGQEACVEDYIRSLTEVFRQVRRVLRPNGTLWLNIGDTYGKDKQLQLIPHRVAISLQSSGWLLRSAIVWHKNRVRPESAADRPTNCYEMVFLFGVAPGYYFDARAIREPCSENSHGSPNINPGTKAEFRKDGGRLGLWTDEDKANGRRPRNVWQFEQQSFKGAHFAPMPQALAERCILAGTKDGDEVIDPFGGSGTTGLVANKLLRSATLIEINDSYVGMARDRLDRGSATGK